MRATNTNSLGSRLEANWFARAVQFSMPTALYLTETCLWPGVLLTVTLQHQQKCLTRCWRWAFGGVSAEIKQPYLFSINSVQIPNPIS